MHSVALHKVKVLWGFVTCIHLHLCIQVYVCILCEFNEGLLMAGAVEYRPLSDCSQSQIAA